MRAVAIVVAVAACAGAPSSAKPPGPVSGPIAGTRWITAAQPWRTSESVAAVLVTGPTALFGGAAGWLAELDLSSGLVVRERTIGTLSISDLLVLADGRILALGIADERAAAMVLDPRTLEGTPLALGGAEAEYTYMGSHGAVLPDGGVVVAAPGLPLAIYDPATWKPRLVLAPEIDWRDPQLVADGIVATRSYQSFKFDVGGGKPQTLPAKVIVAAGSTVVANRYEGGKVLAQARTDGRDPVGLHELGYSVAIDRAGTRLVDLVGDVLTVTSLVDGTTISRFDLSPRSGQLAKLVVFGDRLLVSDSSFVRVIDLTTGYISPRGVAPSGAVSQLAVGDDGGVVALGAEITRFVDGRIASTLASSGPLLTNAPGELRHHGTRTSGRRRKGAVAVVGVRTNSGEHVRTWRLPRHTNDGWLGTRGEVVLVLEYDASKPQRIVRSDGATIHDVTSYNLDASVDDADPDAGLVVLSRKGTAHLVDTTTGERLPVTVRAPRCAEFPSTVIERGGRRLATWDEGEVLVWDRDTGTLVASLAYTEALYAPMFLPGRDELLIQMPGGFVLWSPSTSELRTARIPHLGLAALSPNGKHLALSLRDGRIALADFATARGSLPVARAVAAAAPPDDCGAFDPIEQEEPDDAESDDDEAEGD